MIKIEARKETGEVLDSRIIEKHQGTMMIINVIKYACSGHEILAHMNGLLGVDIEIIVKPKSKQLEMFDKK